VSAAGRDSSSKSATKRSGSSGSGGSGSAGTGRRVGVDLGDEDESEQNDSEQNDEKNDAPRRGRSPGSAGSAKGPLSRLDSLKRALSGGSRDGGMKLSITCVHT
jgi:hypothetical protein